MKLLKEMNIKIKTLNENKTIEYIYINIYRYNIYI